MNVEIGAEAPQFPEKEYIKGITVPLQCDIWVMTVIFSKNAIY
jgi:hypothetical protein